MLTNKIFNASALITVGLRMHITCCASAYQLICKRTTAVVRPEILTNSKTYTIFSNNLYYVFQQHISNIPTNKKRVNHLLMTHPLC